jgi:hypothetical protein
MTEEQIARDKTAIAELIAQYNFAIDHEDYQGWADCFAPAGIFDGVIGKFDAHRDLDRFVTEVKRLSADSPNLRHYVSNILSEVDGDTARSKCFLLMTSATKEGGTKIAIAGEYEDQLVKHDGKWLFSYRKVRADGA